jgi:hypothetical protein
MTPPERFQDSASMGQAQAPQVMEGVMVNLTQTT